MLYDPRLSHFDLDMKRGAQAELFVSDVSRALAERNGTIEVKRDAWFARSQRFYVETQCFRGGHYQPSGIATTKATFWALVWGALPAMLLIETAWLARAVELAGKDRRNHANCNYGRNPTKGIYVYVNHILRTRDSSKDEH